MHPRRGLVGFTLIELLAVVLIIGLLASITLPNFGVRSGRLLEDQARELAATLEFARQRSVMTGIPHRLMFDLDAQLYWLEWYVTEERAGAEPAEDPQPAALQLSPPRQEEPRYRRLQGALGRDRVLPESVFFDGVETTSGYAQRGELELLFGRDGTADATVVNLAAEDGRVLRLEVAPLAERVRFLEPES